MDALTVTVESPLGADLDLLFARHSAHCHADTPPESMHMMGREGLVTQASGFILLAMIYAGIAFAVSRYRLFDIGRWSYRILIYAGMIVALLVLDIAFVLGPQQWSTNLFLAVGTLNYAYKMLAAIALIPLLYLVRRGITAYLGRDQAGQLRASAARD